MEPPISQPVKELESALEAYGARFDNLDELMHPALMARPEFPLFLMRAVEAGKPATQEEAEKEFGAVAWDW